MAKLKLPFELEKPSDNEYVTQASQIGYGNGDVKEELDKLNREIILEGEPVDITGTTTSGYINSSGSVSSSVLAVHTDFIAIDSDKKYYIEGITSDSWYLAYYSSANESDFISAQQLADIGSGNPRTDLSIPDGATHVRVTLSTYNGKFYSTEVELISDTISAIQRDIENIQETIPDIDSSIDLMEGDIDAIKSSIGAESTTPTDITGTLTSGYINSSGGVSVSSVASHTDFITIEPDMSYYIQGKMADGWYIGYYSSNSESGFISAQRCPNSPTTAIKFNLVIPSGAAYLRASLYNFDNPKLYKAGETLRQVGDEIDSITEDITDIERNVSTLDLQVTSIASDVTEIKSSIGIISETLNITGTLETGYINSSGTVTSSSASKHTDFIEIEANKSYYTLSKQSDSWYIGYYSSASENDFISGQKCLNSLTEVARLNLVIPNGATHFRATLYGFEDASLYSHEAHMRNVGEELNDLEAKVGSSAFKMFSGIDRIGFLKCPTLFEADIMYVPMYGQSYTVANDGEYKITDVFDSNTYMHHASHPVGKGDTTLRALNTDANRELTISDFANTFSKLLKRYTCKQQDILVGSYGQGSRSVMELSPNNGYGVGYHAYEDIFEPGVANAVQAATNASKTIKCPFILYLQGESDTASTRSTAATPDSWCKGDKATYKQYMLALKTSMQQTVMQATGQTEPPLVIMYTCGNTDFKSLECGIQQAVLELCQENEDMFTVGSYYWMTSMGAHLSPDGRRWLAELFAKQVFDIFVRGEESTMKVVGSEVDDKSVILYVKTPYPPLMWDTWTYPQRSNYGFMLYKDVSGTLVNIPISSVRIENGSQVRITTNTDLSELTLFVTYGNNAVNGGGNLRDSGIWHSYELYESNNDGSGHIVYIPLGEDGNNIIDKHYPMQTWMPQFGIYINQL